MSDFIKVNRAKLIAEALDVRRTQIPFKPGTLRPDKMPNRLGYQGKEVNQMVATMPVDDYQYPIESPNGAPFRADNLGPNSGYLAKPLPSPEDDVTEEDVNAFLDEVMDMEVYGDVKRALEMFNEDHYFKNMTPERKRHRNTIVNKLRKHLGTFKKRYGSDAKNVMYAVATKQVMHEETEKELRAKEEKGESKSKKGKSFKEIAKKAAKHYGSKKAGERVAAAIMWNKVHHEEANLTEDINTDQENIQKLVHSYSKYRENKSIEREPGDAAGARVLAQKYAKLARHSENPMRQAELKQTAQKFYDTSTRLTHRHLIGRKKLASEEINKIDEDTYEVNDVFQAIQLAKTEAEGIDFMLPTGGNITITPATADKLLAMYPPEKFTAEDVASQLAEAVLIIEGIYNEGEDDEEAVHARRRESLKAEIDRGSIPEVRDATHHGALNPEDVPFHWGDIEALGYGRTSRVPSKYHRGLELTKRHYTGPNSIKLIPQNAEMRNGDTSGDEED